MSFKTTAKRVLQNGWFRRGAALVAAAVIFLAGVGVGQGKIYVGMLNKTQSGLPASLNYASVNQLYQTIRAQYDGKVTTTQLLNGMKNGMVEALNDPYSEYFTPSQATAFNDEEDGSFTGIGAEIGQTASGAIQIVAPLSGSPAAKTGLKAQDIITAINGTSTSGMSPDTAVDDIRGAAGTKVTLTITRGSQTNMQFTITRANVVVPSVTSSIINGDIGYLQISQFTDDTSSLANAAAQNFRKEKVKGVILDLRDNPGGFVTGAVDVSSLWLQDGQTIMQAKRGNSVLETYTASANNTLQNVPTVVLVDGGTASAAEITAAALHDNGAATIVGEKTYGKGVMQQIDNLPGGAELKVTIASWYRPDGKSINHIGITPDKVVAASTSGSDAQEAAALAILTK